MRCTFVVVSWLLPMASIVAADPSETTRHQGTWVVASYEFNGLKTPPETLATIRRIVDGDHVVWKRDGKNFAGTTVVLDPSKSPKTLDVTPDGGPGRGEAVSGIYVWDGDVLKICMAGRGKPRPDAFQAGPGTGRTLMTFRREEKDAKDR